MEPIIYILLGALLIIIIMSISNRVYRNYHLKKVKEETIAILGKYGEVTISNKEIIFKYNNNSYNILYQYVSSSNELTVNSKTIWEVHTRNNKNKLLNKRNLTNLRRLNIVMVYPSANKIKRYINENEIEYIENQRTYNFYLIPYKNIEGLIKELWKY